LSPGEEELIKLRNRMKANRKAKAKAKDKRDKEMNEPNEENNMPADTVRCEEHDIYMNRLLKSLKTTDKDGITKDPFISVGEKYINVAQFKECLTYCGLANGFSLWYERSGEVRVVAKCGQRPPRVSDPEKGKQRKQTKYPCATSDELHKCPWRCYDRWMTDEKTFQCISLVDEHTCVGNFNFGALVNYKWIAKNFGDKIRANPDIRLCDIADLVMKKYKCKVSLNQCTNAKKYALTEYEKSIDEHYSLLRSYGKAILDYNLGSIVKLGVAVNPDGKTYFDSPNQGEILTAIERDGNKHIYPVAWAVSRIEVVKDVMPNAEHRQCARHIYENFKKQYLGLEYRQLGCEAIDNGFSECFNSVIVNVRHKPLLTMLEAIRVIVLERINTMREISRKVNPGVCPNIKKRLEWLKEQQRMWQLSGLPCVHATTVIFLINKIMYSTVLPPKPRKMVGRPRKKRIRAIGEGGSSTRVSKVGSHGSCSNCEKPGHNKSSCKEPVVEQTPKPKGVLGRPRKKQPVDDFEDVDVAQRSPVRDEGASV
ncbi:hypothetical protein Tco_0058860, partial [Tanacetum coccineum]